MDKVQRERERCLQIVNQAIQDNEQRAVRAVLTRIINEIAKPRLGDELPTDELTSG
ncbi:hypothetical protein Poly21_31850 [Allorhodopirellula heiligendammensis]|uniref:Uncharacterized protein n=1 Tax=Allorhodopirellula heiligendammensis TaxID=2714739 RepID=A0A5C6BWU3_9BACT|nr:hypothetical protein Poly21_31850 [Allorhodopirellula heiligendammensis]